MLSFIVGVVIGAVLAYAFRGKVNKAVETVKADVEKEIK